jgi:hypothetical protein
LQIAVTKSRQIIGRQPAQRTNMPVSLSLVQGGRQPNTGAEPVHRTVNVLTAGRGMVWRGFDNPAKHFGGTVHRLTSDGSQGRHRSRIADADGVTH